MATSLEEYFRAGMNRAVEPVEPVGPATLPEPVTSEQKLDRFFYNAFKRVRRTESSALKAALGLGVQAAYEVGSLASLASKLEPTAMWARGGNALASGKPSDLIKGIFAETEFDRGLESMMNNLDMVFRDDDAVEFGRFIGKWGPALFGGAMAANTSRSILMASAPELLKTAGERKLLNQFLPWLAKGMAGVGDKMATSALRRAKGEVVGGIPLFERSLMAVGNGLGIGAFEATREFSQEGDFQVALKHGAVIAGVGAVGEAGLVGLGRLAFPSLRRGPVDLAVLRKRWEEVGPDIQDKILSGDVSGLRILEGKKYFVGSKSTTKLKKTMDFLTKQEEALAKLSDEGVIPLADDFAEMTKKMSVAERSSRLKQVVGAYQVSRGRAPGKIEDTLAKDMNVFDPHLQGLLTDDAIDEAAKVGIRKTLGGRRKKFRKKVDAIHEAETQLRSAYHNMNAMNFGLAVSPNLRRAWDDTFVCPQTLLAEAQNTGNLLAQRAMLQKHGVYGMTHPGTRARQAANAVNRAYLSVNANVLEPFFLKWAVAPGSLGKQLGVSGLRYLELIEQAETFTRMSRAKIHVGLEKMNSEVLEVMNRPGWIGRRHPAFAGKTKIDTTDNAHFRPIRDLYELDPRGLVAVEESFGTEIADSLRRHVVEPLDLYGRGLAKIGVNSTMSQPELKMLGVHNYLPHVVKRTDKIGQLELQFGESLAARMEKTSEEIAKIMGSGSWKQTGAKRFGTIDQQRQIPGSTSQKIAGTYGVKAKPGPGIPLEDDFVQALKDHFDASIVRLELGTRFGADFELGTFYKAAMIAEGGSEAAAHMLVDSTLFQSTSNHFAAKLARNVNALQMIVKLTWAPIPNAFQTVMTAIRVGPEAAMKGTVKANRDLVSTFKAAGRFKDVLATTDKEVIAESLGLLEGSLLSSRTIFMGDTPKTLLERIAERQLKWTGFTITERMNRMIAAHAGLGEARLLVEGIVSGKYVGANLVKARRSLDSFGVDIDQVAKRYQATGKLGLSARELDSVVTQAVKQTQFSTGALDVPTQWRTPHGRVVMQFKSFAFNAGRLVRDQVLKEFDQGNYKPFLYFMSLGSMTGEAVGMSLDIAKSRPRDAPNGPWRVLEDLSNFGGFGLATAVLQGALYRRLPEYFIGPMYSDMIGQATDIIQAAATGEPSKAFRTAARQPVVKALGHPAMKIGARLVAGSADAISNGWDFDFGGEDPVKPREGESLEDLRRRIRRGR